MANQVRIEYDPYHTQIFYNWRTDSEREWGQLTNSILTKQGDLSEIIPSEHSPRSNCAD